MRSAARPSARPSTIAISQSGRARSKPCMAMGCAMSRTARTEPSPGALSQRTWKARSKNGSTSKRGGAIESGFETTRCRRRWMIRVARSILSAKRVRSGARSRYVDGDRRAEERVLLDLPHERVGIAHAAFEADVGGRELLDLRHRHAALHRGRAPTSSIQRSTSGSFATSSGKHLRERLPRRVDPRIGRDVRDRVIVGEVARCAGERGVQHAEDAQRLAEEAVDRVRNALRRLVDEVPGLPEDRADVAHLVHQPLDHGARAGVLGKEAAGLLGEVDQDRPGLEDRERATRDVVVDDRRDLLVRVDRGERGVFCSSFARSTGITRYGRAVSSRMIEILRPFGVVHV